MSLRELPLIFVLLGTLPVSPGQDSFSDQGKNLDNFLLRTGARVSEAWTLCVQEFRLAAQHAGDEPAKIVEREIRARTDAIVDDISDKAADAMREKMKDARDDAINQAKDALPAPPAVLSQEGKSDVRESK